MRFNKSPLFSFVKDLDVFEKGSNTTIYIDWEIAKSSLYLLSKDPSKYEYYKFALENKFKYIPKIHSLLKDEINEVYLIHRECCNPIVKSSKLARVEKIRFEAKHSEAEDPVAKELLEFFYMGYDYQFDFGSHWLMQTDYGKIVVCDAFI